MSQFTISEGGEYPPPFDKPTLKCEKCLEETYPIRRHLAFVDRIEKAALECRKCGAFLAFFDVRLR
jgi:hypothetical protein